MRGVIMVIPTFTDIKKQWPWALLDLLLILAILVILGSALAVSVLLMPIISGALALSLLPQIMMTIVILLPLIACTALLVQFLESQWLIYKEINLEANSAVIAGLMTEGEAWVMHYSLWVLFIMPFLKI